jgi:hypothetical protein
LARSEPRLGRCCVVLLLWFETVARAERSWDGFAGKWVAELRVERLVVGEALCRLGWGDELDEVGTGRVHDALAGVGFAGVAVALVGE